MRTPGGWRAIVSSFMVTHARADAHAVLDDRVAGEEGVGADLDPGADTRVAAQRHTPAQHGLRPYRSTLAHVCPVADDDAVRKAGLGHDDRAGAHHDGVAERDGPGGRTAGRARSQHR